MNKTTYDTIEETVYKMKLDNGLNVVLLPKEAVSKTYALFMTDYGSIHRTFVPIGEEEQVTVPDGIAHFLEHKLFEKEDYDVFTTFLNQSASPNAFTSFTKTAYLFSTTKSIKENVETLLDFVQEPYFSDESVEKEKGIIEQEIQMYQDNPDWRSFMGTIENMFANHPVNINILGTVDSINKITKEDLYTCYHTFYHPENMTLLLIGNFHVEEMAQLIKENQHEKQFAPAEELQTFFPEEPRAVAQKESVIHLPVAIPKVAIGIKESHEPLDKEMFIKRETMQSMLLDYFFSTSGTFYKELYDSGLIDASFSYSTSVEQSFAYSIISSNTEDPEAYAERVKQLLMRTNNMSISETDFETMKKLRIGTMLRAMNSLEYIARKYIQYDFLNIDFYEMIPYIQSLTLEEMNAFLNEWITEEKLTVCKVMATK